jgi:hypothetical protein
MAFVAGQPGEETLVGQREAGQRQIFNVYATIATARNKSFLTNVGPVLAMQESSLIPFFLPASIKQDSRTRWLQK